MRKPLLVAAVVMSLVLAACGSRISAENYEKIHNGMSMDEVKKVLGKPTEVSSFGIGDLSATTARWVGRSQTITITFANNKVKLKTLTGSSKDSGGGDEDDGDNNDK